MADDPEEEKKVDELLRSIEAGEGYALPPRWVDFRVVFSAEAAARSFGDHFYELGYDIYGGHFVGEGAEEMSHPFVIELSKHMAPTVEAVEGFEAELDAVAKPLGGHNDGWRYPVVVPDASPVSAPEDEGKIGRLMVHKPTQA